RTFGRHADGPLRAIGSQRRLEGTGHLPGRRLEGDRQAPWPGADAREAAPAKPTCGGLVVRGGGAKPIAELLRADPVSVSPVAWVTLRGEQRGERSGVARREREQQRLRNLVVPAATQVLSVGRHRGANRRGADEERENERERQDVAHPPSE